MIKLTENLKWTISNFRIDLIELDYLFIFLDTFNEISYSYTLKILTEY